LNFSQDPPRLDIGQYFFQIPDTSCKRLHLAKAFIYLFQTFANHFKRLADSLFQGFLQFFVNRFPHLFQFSFIVSLHRNQSVFHRFVDLTQHFSDRFLKSVIAFCQVQVQLGKTFVLKIGRTVLRS
jgi:hypothetical protein